MIINLDIFLLFRTKQFAIPLALDDARSFYFVESERSDKRKYIETS